MVCIKLSIRQNLFPVHSADQYPCPFLECIHRISSLSFSQDGSSGLALLRRIPRIADEVLLLSLLLGARSTVCLCGKRVCREYKRDDHKYAGQQAQSAVSTSWVAGGARFLISECSCHVVLSRGVPRWGTTCAESPAHLNGSRLNWLSKECWKGINR